MKNPTHENVAIDAYQLWHDSGRRDGQDKEHWLEAEQRLAHALQVEASPAASSHATHIPGDSPAAHAQDEIATEQRHEARAAKTPHKFAPHAKPPESGKPLWSQPHSQ